MSITVNLNFVDGFDEVLEEQEEPTLVAANDPLATIATQDEHVSGQQLEKKKIDNASQYMADVLTNFGLLYGAKEDAELKAKIQLSLKIVKMKFLAKERAIQARIKAEERMNQTRIEAKERMAKRAKNFKLMMESFRRDNPC